MKRKLPALLLIIFCFAMFGVIILGSCLGKPWLWKLGIGLLFGGSFFIALIYSIVFVVRACKNSGQKDGQQDGEDITDKIIDENGEVNCTAYAEHEIGKAVSNYKASSRKEKIFGTVLLVTLLSCFIGGIILFAFMQLIAGGVLIGAFVLIIVSCIVVTSIKQRIAMSGRGISQNAPVHEAAVTACTLSSSTSFGGKTSVVYKVRLDLDGAEKVTYSKNYYEAGETVSVRGDKYGKRFVIVDDGERHTPYYSGQNQIKDNDEDTDLYKVEDYDTED